LNFRSVNLSAIFPQLIFELQDVNLSAIFQLDISRLISWLWQVEIFWKSEWPLGFSKLSCA
jgi:hypothetical protein